MNVERRGIKNALENIGVALTTSRSNRFYTRNALSQGFHFCEDLQQTCCEKFTL